MEATRLELVTSSMPWKRSTKTELRPREGENVRPALGPCGPIVDRAGVGSNPELHRGFQRGSHPDIPIPVSASIPQVMFRYMSQYTSLR